MSVSNIMEKRMKVFSWNFQGRSGMWQRTINTILEPMWLTCSPVWRCILLLTHWSYVFLALTYQYKMWHVTWRPFFEILSCTLTSCSNHGNLLEVRLLILQSPDFQMSCATLIEMIGYRRSSSCNGIGVVAFIYKALQWRHNERDGVSNHRRLDCLLNRLFRRWSKKQWKLRIIGLCERNPPVIGGFPSQRARNAENVSIWWRHHGILLN